MRKFSNTTTLSLPIPVQNQNFDFMALRMHVWNALLSALVVALQSTCTLVQKFAEFQMCKKWWKADWLTFQFSINILNTEKLTWKSSSIHFDTMLTKVQKSRVQIEESCYWIVTKLVLKLCQNTSLALFNFTKQLIEKYTTFNKNQQDLPLIVFRPLCQLCTVVHKKKSVLHKNARSLKPLRFAPLYFVSKKNLPEFESCDRPPRAELRPDPLLRGIVFLTWKLVTISHNIQCFWTLRTLTYWLFNVSSETGIPLIGGNTLLLSWLCTH